MLLRTGWSRRTDPAAFLNVGDDGPHSPGFHAAASRLLAHDRDVLGVGVETIGTDAGQAGTFDPPFPNHDIMHGAGKFGLASLCNLDQLPADRRGRHRRAAEDRQRQRQPAARDRADALTSAPRRARGVRTLTRENTTAPRHGFHDMSLRISPGLVKPQRQRLDLFLNRQRSQWMGDGASQWVNGRMGELANSLSFTRQHIDWRFHPSPHPTSTSLSRATARSRPTSSSTSKMPGLTAWPVTPTRVA